MPGLGSFVEPSLNICRDKVVLTNLPVIQPIIVPR